MRSSIENRISAFDAIVERRSIRRFVPTEVPDDIVTAILEAASRAPSNMNVQPWFVHVVTGGGRKHD